MQTDKIFLDSDVLLDYLTARKPFYVEIRLIMHKGIRQELNLYTSSLIMANIHFIISKLESKKQATTKLDKLTKILTILNVGEDEILTAIKSKFKDFEDSIQNTCATNSGMSVIVTRNVKDYKLSDLPVLTPKELLAQLESK